MATFGTSLMEKNTNLIKKEFSIEILHLFNPHIIIVKAIEYNAVYQIGIFDILPNQLRKNCVSQSLLWDDNCIKICQNSFDDAKNISFLPIHCCKRKSLFDNIPIYYGEIKLQQYNSIISLSDILCNSKLAYNEKKFANIEFHLNFYRPNKDILIEVNNKIKTCLMSLQFKTCDLKTETHPNYETFEKNCVSYAPDGIKIGNYLRKSKQNESTKVNNEGIHKHRSFQHKNFFIKSQDNFTKSTQQDNSDDIKKYINNKKTYFFNNISEVQNNNSQLNNNLKNQQRFNNINTQQIFKSHELVKNKDVDLFRNNLKKYNALSNENNLQQCNSTFTEKNKQWFEFLNNKDEILSTNHHCNTRINMFKSDNYKISQQQSNVFNTCDTKEKNNYIGDNIAQEYLFQSNYDIGNKEFHLINNSSQEFLEKKSIEQTSYKNDSSLCNNNLISKPEVPESICRNTENIFSSTNKICDNSIVNKSNQPSNDLIPNDSSHHIDYTSKSTVGDSICVNISSFSNKILECDNSIVNRNNQDTFISCNRSDDHKNINIKSTITDDRFNGSVTDMKVTSNVNSYPPFLNQKNNYKFIAHYKGGNYSTRWMNTSRNNFHSIIHSKLLEKNKQPMALQTAMWPAALEGYNVLCIGKKNTGKTFGTIVAFCDLILKELNYSTFNLKPIGIIISHSANDVNKIFNICKYFLPSNTKLLQINDVHNEREIIELLCNGCDVLITVPKTLKIIDYRGSFLNLERLKYIVMDNFDLLVEDFYNYFNNIYKVSQKNNVKILITGRHWCRLMNNFINKISNTVLCINAYTEYIIYSQTDVEVNIMLKKEKVNNLSLYLNSNIQNIGKTIIVCNDEEEVQFVFKALKLNRIEVTTLKNMTNYETLQWKQKCNTSSAVLVCSDDTLHHLNVYNANILINYSLPKNKAVFNSRFTVLTDNIPNMFKNNKYTSNYCKTILFVDESCNDYLNEIICFIKRCGVYINDELDEKIKLVNETNKKNHMNKLCNRILDYGVCNYQYTCKCRHVIEPNIDKLHDWIPKTGYITVKLIYIHNASYYSVRLLEHISIEGKKTTFADEYTDLSLKMSCFYLKQINRKLISKLKNGEICCVQLKHKFHRCLVINVNTNNDFIVIKLLDENYLTYCKKQNLFILPEEFKNINTNVIHIRLAGIVAFIGSDVLLNHAKKIIFNSENDILLRGKIVLGINECVWLESVQCCQMLSCNEIITKSFWKKYLLSENLVYEDSNQLRVLYDLCNKYLLELPIYNAVPIQKKKLNNLPKPQWAHLDNENFYEAYITAVISPTEFFVNIKKWNDCLNSLTKELAKYVEECKKNNKYLKTNKFEIGDYCVAEYLDSTFHRIRIESIEYEPQSVSQYKAKCFFVDFGDSHWIKSENLCSIKSDFIVRLPFQAIECRLLGLDYPNEMSTRTFTNMSFESDDSDYWKLLNIISYSNEIAKHTDGLKYAIGVVDNNKLLNDYFIEKELATPIKSECDLLNKCTEKIKDLQSISNKANSIESGDFQSDSDIEDEYTLDLFDENKWDCTFDPDVIKDIFYESVQSQLNANCVESNFVSFPEKNKNENLIEISNDINPNQLNEIFEKPKPKNEVNINDVKQSENNEFKRVEKSPYKFPSITWYETNEIIYLKIHLSPEKYELDIKEISLHFLTDINGDKYKFNLEMNGAVILERCYHKNCGLYILVKLTKLITHKWIEFAKNCSPKLLHYDFEFYEDDSIDHNQKDMCEKENEINIHKVLDESDSEDDACGSDLDLNNDITLN